MIQLQKENSSSISKGSNHNATKKRIKTKTFVDEFNFNFNQNRILRSSLDLSMKFIVNCRCESLGKECLFCVFMGLSKE